MKFISYNSNIIHYKSFDFPNCLFKLIKIQNSIIKYISQLSEQTVIPYQYNSIYTRFWR